MKKEVTALTIVLTVSIIGIILWKYYNVAKTGDNINPSNNKTAEERILNKAVAQVGEISEGQIIQTPYGEYEFKTGAWIKTKELFNILTL